MILFHCSRMNANITPYACGMNQTAQFACVGCNQEGKAPRGTAKRVPVDQHEKFVPEKRKRDRTATSRPITKGKPEQQTPANTEGRATGKDAPPPVPLWDRSHPCPGCGVIIIGHHWCRPCRRAVASDNPEAALKEVRRMRKAGMIHKGWPKGRTRHRVAYRQTVEGV